MRAVGTDEVKWIVISPEHEEKTSKTGILLGEIKSLRFRKAKVISSSTTIINDGDTVLYDRSNAHSTMTDEKYLIIRDRDIAVVL